MEPKRIKKIGYRYKLPENTVSVTRPSRWANSQTDAQSVTPANVELTITDVAFTTRAAGNIVRDGNIILVMPADSADSFNFSNDFGIALNEKANANVVVNLGATEGVCIIQFSKGSGYNDRDLQPRPVS